jgi:hypothetical protein
MSQIESDQIVGWAPRDTDDAGFYRRRVLVAPICPLDKAVSHHDRRQSGCAVAAFTTVHVFSSSAEAITSETIARTSSSVVR